MPKIRDCIAMSSLSLRFKTLLLVLASTLVCFHISSASAVAASAPPTTTTKGRSSALSKEEQQKHLPLSKEEQQKLLPGVLAEKMLLIKKGKKVPSEVEDLLIESKKHNLSQVKEIGYYLSGVAAVLAFATNEENFVLPIAYNIALFLLGVVLVEGTRAIEFARLDCLLRQRLLQDVNTPEPKCVNLAGLFFTKRIFKFLFWQTLFWLANSKHCPYELNIIMTFLSCLIFVNNTVKIDFIGFLITSLAFPNNQFKASRCLFGFMVWEFIDANY